MSHEYYLRHRQEIIERSRAWVVNNPEKAKEKSRKYYLEHKEKYREHGRKWKKENPEKVNAESRRRYAANPEKHRDVAKKYHATHRDKSRARAREWKARNRDKLRAYRQSYYATHPESIILRSAATWLIEHSPFRKSSSSREYVGCSSGFLRNHLESLFKPGMSWQNWGTAWEVDHIVPLSWFPFDKDLDLLFVASHWTNLQPMWKVANRIKGNRHAS